MKKYLVLNASLVALALTSIDAAILITDDFTGSTPFTVNNTVPNANTWYTDDALQFGLNDPTDSARRFLTGNLSNIEAIAYATTDAVVVDKNLAFTFNYNNTFTTINVTYSIFGSPIGFDGYGGGGTRVRTDSLTPGSEWVILNSHSETIPAGSGSKTLIWTHTGTNYTGVAIQIATFTINPGSGTFFDVQSVELAAVPEPSTYAFLLGSIFLGVVLLRRRSKI